MKNSTLSVLVLLLVSMLNVGCSKNSDDKYKSSNFKSLTQELSKASFLCENGSDCPENVGMILANHSNATKNPEITYCSGFLISHDTVATNRHCVPMNLRTGQVIKCNKSMAIRFKGEFGDEIYECEDLISFSREDDARDYAFFKIKSTNLKPFKVSKSGLKEGEKISSLRMTPMKGVIGGTLGRKECNVVANSFMNILGSIGAWSETAVAMGCSAQGGNSGSPIVNENNEVIGILQAYLMNGSINVMRNKYSLFDFVMPATLPTHGLFTNFSCVDDPVFGAGQQKACQEIKGLNPRVCLMKDAIPISSMDNFLSDWEKTLPSEVLFDVYIDMDDKSTVARPRCVVDHSLNRGLAGQVQQNTQGKSINVSSKLNLQPEFETSISAKFQVLHKPINSRFSSSFLADLELFYFPGESGMWQGRVSYAGFGKPGVSEDISISDCSEEDKKLGHQRFVNKDDVAVSVQDYEDLIASMEMSSQNLCSVK